MIRVMSRRSDSGETLIEILLAIAILGIAATGLIAGLSTGILASDSHRRISNAESVLRAYGEYVKDKVIHPQATTLTADVPTYSNGDNLTLQVADTSTFTDSGQYTISVDGVVMKVKSQTATSFDVQTLGGGTARSGATVQRYEACPRPSYWADVTAGHPELTGERLAAPVVSSVTFYDKQNNAMTPAQCDTYFNTAGATTCSLSGDERTECDPPWMKVAIRVDEDAAARQTCRTDPSTGTPVCAATDVFIRRIP